MIKKYKGPDGEVEAVFISGIGHVTELFDFLPSGFSVKIGEVAVKDSTDKYDN